MAVGLAVFPLVSPGLTGKTVPFSFRDIDDRPVRLADFRGQWLLVAFWAPWCPMCKLEMPALKQLDARPDLSVLGVGLDYDSPDALRETANRFDLPFRIVAGGSRRAPDSPHRQVGPVDYFPTSYLYDPSGEIVMYIPGQVNVNKVVAFMAAHPAGAAGATAAAPVARNDRLAAFLRDRYGAKGSQAYADWQRLVDQAAGAGAADKLARANDFFNRRMLQSTDQRAWGQADHWATLGEFLGRGMGDGEDFAIAKYFTLRAMGIPAEQLRLVYVKLRGGGDPVHMVLAYFDQPGREPVLLDNRVADIQPAGQRSDLRPVLSFNDEGAWGDSQDVPEAAGGRLPLWDDVLRRARDEGFQ
ncbi:redoxin domain-containing protein [Parasulfuritortus cantonensis]|uniref:redoxin domain-containing protein n=1 Tax=Parasulfuritortus cantonensis TaxID=2528202 RepID=UPI001404930F|nr:redoxin domain-containing protein [Parasulfuritortus cantonensis]